MLSRRFEATPRFFETLICIHQSTRRDIPEEWIVSTSIRTQHPRSLELSAPLIECKISHISICAVYLQPTGCRFLEKESVGTRDCSCHVFAADSVPGIRQRKRQIATAAQEEIKKSLF